MDASQSYEFEAIGTHWQVDIAEQQTPNFLRGLFVELRERVELFEATYSRFRNDSLIDNIAHQNGEYRLPPDAQTLFDLYRKLYDLTKGKVTPLIGNTLVEAGYDKTYSLKQGVLHSPPPWEDVLEYSFPNLIVKNPTQLDLGALGKGYLIDIVGKLLEERGINSYTIDAGGDIRHRNSKNELLIVGLEHPDDKAKVIGTINIKNQSICGSSGNRRAWGNMHHIIDPHTTSSPKNILGLWAVAETTLIADAMTTALFFIDPKALMKEFSFEYLIMYSDSSIVRSLGFTADLFTKK